MLRNFRDREIVISNIVIELAVEIDVFFEITSTHYKTNLRHKCW